MGNDICHRVVKKPSVCTLVEDSRECKNILGDPETGKIDPTKRSKVCKWKKAKGCYTNNVFSKFYDDNM